MNGLDPKLVDELFSAALELSVVERSTFLDQHCSNNTALRDRIEQLLAGADSPEEGDPFQFLRVSERTLKLALTGRDDASEDLSGEKIGHWLIEKQIARGGLSTVYLAHRDDGQYNQRVALKVLRRGLDTDDIIARFHSERQILSALDHPAIARIIDGGAMADGRPYLVLEFVNGLPITDYCHKHRCPEQQIIGFIIETLRAVAHAHKFLVVHRDIKPSNIMVSTEGRVTLLDFGIAKLLDPDTVPGASMHTREGVLLLTPGYGSPEQLAGGAITTASDIFQVGRVLENLLTGKTPIKAEGDVASPSIKFSADIEAIMHKAMDPDALERYSSAGDFIDDLNRYLGERPVHARPDSMIYRARKLIARRPWLLPVIALGVFIASSYVFTLKRHNETLTLEKQRATTAMEFMLETLRRRDPFAPTDAREGHEFSIVKALEFGVKSLQERSDLDPVLRHSLLTEFADTLFSLDQHHKTIELREYMLNLERDQFGTNSPQVIASLASLAGEYKAIGNYDKAGVMFKEQLEIARQIYSTDNPELGVAEAYSGNFELRKGNLTESEALLQSGIAKMMSQKRQYARPLISAVVHLSRVQMTNQPTESLYQLSEALRLAEEVFGHESALVGLVLTQTGSVLLSQGNFVHSEQQLNAAINIFQGLLGRDHGETLAALTVLGKLFQARGTFAQAETVQREVLQYYLSKYGMGHRGVADAYENLAITLVSQNRLNEAVPLFQKSHESTLAVLGEEHPAVYIPLVRMIQYQLDAGAFLDAESSASRLLDQLQNFDSLSSLTDLTRCMLGLSLVGQGQVVEQQQYQLESQQLNQAGTIPLPYPEACRSTISN